MEQLGFIKDMMDVKILILYAMARVKYPVDAQQLYEICYQDDRLSYFDLREALPELVSTGHLAQNGDGRYEITEKGRENGGVVEDALARSVARRVEQAVGRFNNRSLRESRIHTEILTGEKNGCSVVMRLENETGRLMTLELTAPTKPQARRLAAAFQKQAEEIYQNVMKTLLQEIERKN